MNIRRARESEAADLSALAVASKAYWPYSAEQIEAWRSDLTISSEMIASFHTYVAEAEANIAGFFILIPASPHWALEHFWVSPASMGRSIGRALISHAIKLTADAGVATIAIDADPHAEQFYLAIGAQRTGTISAPIEGIPDRVRPQLLLSTTHHC
jgi:ribosomal protein S18 acetylase RimI-like enzyme